MVSVFVYGSSDLGSSTGWGHSIVLLGKTLYRHSASLHSAEFDGGNPAMGYHHNQAGVEILRVRIMSRNRDKLRPDRSLGSYADFYPLPKQAANNCTHKGL